jgi:single-stranded DNA-binding protein
MEMNIFCAEGRVPMWNESIKTYNADDEQRCVVRTSISQKYFGKKDENGYYPEQIISLTLFGKTAKNFASTVKAGDRISIQGEYRAEPYTDKDGNKKVSTYIKVDKFNKTHEQKAATTAQSSHGGSEDSGFAPSNYNYGFGGTTSSATSIPDFPF